MGEVANMYSAEPNKTPVKPDTGAGPAPDNKNNDGQAGDNNQQTSVDSGDNNSSLGSGDWRDSLSDDLKNSPTLKDIKDVAGLAKVYVDQAKFLGTSLRMPPENPTEGDMKAFMEKAIKASGDKLQLVPDPTSEGYEDTVLKQLGVPEEANGYKLPEGIEGLDENWLKDTHELMHMMKLTPAQHDVFIKESYQRGVAANEEAAKVHADDIRSLRESWGSDTDRRIDVAAGYAKASNAPQALQDAVMNGQADSAILKWLYDQSQQVGGEAGEIARQGIGKVDTNEDMRQEIRVLEERMSTLDANPTAATRQQQSEIQKKINDIRQKLLGQKK